MNTSASSTAMVYHLPSTHSTIVDILATANIKDILPSLSQSAQSSWPMLMCDHTGNMSIALVSTKQSEPIIIPLESPHSETLRSTIAYRSALYSCGDDGLIVQWQPSTINNKDDEQKQTISKKKSTNRNPY